MRTKKGIYQIKNMVNGKIYVGSTNKSFNERWNAHLSNLSKGKHHNIKLQRSYNKHGKDNFLFEVLEVVKEDCKDKILEREQYWINELRPDYNIHLIASCSRYERKGTKFSIKGIENLSKSHEKFKYHLVSPQGIHFCITNLCASARDNNLADTHLHSVVTGKYPAYRGWRGTTIKEDGSLLFPLIWEPKDKYHLISPEGIHFCVWNLAEFTRDNSLSQPNLREVVNGRRREEKGWRGSIITSEGLTPHLIREPEHKYHLISPEGIEMSTSNLQELCKEYKLQIVHMYAVVGKRRSQHKGWKVTKV